MLSITSLTAPTIARKSSRLIKTIGTLNYSCKKLKISRLCGYFRTALCLITGTRCSTQTLIRYVEQNPLRAKLVIKAEEWPWSSLYRRQRNNKEDQKLLAPLPTELPLNYLESVNTILNKSDLAQVRRSLTKSAPYDEDISTEVMVEKYNLGGTQRGSGRPKNV